MIFTECLFRIMYNTYYIWVGPVSSGGQGAYSDRQQERTYNGKLQTLSSTYSVDMYILHTWDNYALISGVLYKCKNHCINVVC